MNTLICGRCGAECIIGTNPFRPIMCLNGCPPLRLLLPETLTPSPTRRCHWRNCSAERAAPRRLCERHLAVSRGYYRKRLNLAIAAVLLLAIVGCSDFTGTRRSVAASTPTPAPTPVCEVGGRQRFTVTTDQNGRYEVQVPIQEETPTEGGSE